MIFAEMLDYSIRLFVAIFVVILDMVMLEYLW